MHFYTADGESRHTIIGKNGKERTTSIADARKLGLFPSVTTVMDVAGKPAVIQWLQNELLLAALNTPFHPHEFEADDWKKLMLRNMRAKSEKAAARGTDIHNKLEKYFTTGEIDKKDKKYLIPVIEIINDTFPNSSWIAEARFTNKKYGYSGCIDLHKVANKNDKAIIIDFKTKDKTNLKDFVQYDEHKMQLAAYQAGIASNSECRRFNLFISVNVDTPGLCQLVECTEYDRYLNMFLSLNTFWQLKNKYDPRFGAVVKGKINE
jgi:hypothetical protein